MSAIPALSLSTLNTVSRPTPATLLDELRARRPTLSLTLGDVAARGPAEHDEHALSSLMLTGGVVELEALPGAGALTLALLLLAESRRRALAAGQAAWLCAVDATRTLHAPAVAALGVDLAHLVVLQPPRDRLLRTAVRAQRCGAFCGILVDASGETDLASSTTVTGVRRLALAVEETRGLAVMVTSRRAKRGLPLPTAARAMVETTLAPDGEQELQVRFLRHRHGRTAPLAITRAQPSGAQHALVHSG
jgi:hypothetical protein